MAPRIDTLRSVHPPLVPLCDPPFIMVPGGKRSIVKGGEASLWT